MKYKSLSLLIIVLFSACTIGAQNRKKVGIVLSGGGAKGVAHIGALKVIEEAGIPIDYVVGTSMGAIVGGLYSIGYTPQQLDSIVNAQDWKYLLSDALDPETTLLSEKLREEQYLLSVPIAGKSAHVSDAGIIKGRNISRLLSELTVGYHDSISFNRMPIPFACVSDNIVNGSKVVFHNGILATAMRASMSIPGVFAPVYLNGMVLVDGGLTDNYPVDIARQMGAEIIIGVDVQNPLMKADELTSMSNVLGQILNLVGEESYRKNVKDSNIHIQVDVDGYSAASFNHEALDTLMRRGKEAAMKDWDKLIALKKEIGIRTNYRAEYPGPFKIPTRAMLDTIPSVAQITPHEKPVNTINIGGRFDNEELAVLLLNARGYFGAQKKSQLSLTTRLGKRTFGRLEYTYSPQKSWDINTGYQIGYNDFNLYEEGKRLMNLTYVHHMAWVGFTKSWYKMLVKAGIHFEKFNYHDWPSGPDVSITRSSDKALLSYQASIMYNSLNNQRFSTQGMEWEAAYRLYTDNMVTYGSNSPVSVFQTHWSGYFSPNRVFTIMPSVYGRIVGKNTQSLAISNFVGGNVPGRYIEQQIPFTGINHIEISPDAILAGMLGVRARTYKNQYIVVRGSYGRTANKIENLFGGTNTHGLAGGSIGYCYNSIIGPIEAELNYSNQSKKLGYYIGIGFTF